MNELVMFGFQARPRSEERTTAAPAAADELIVSFSVTTVK